MTPLFLNLLQCSKFMLKKKHGEGTAREKRIGKEP
jgi:hypothetical protein